MAFVSEEMWQRVQNGFSIILIVADAVRVFGDKLKVSCIVAVPQEHHQPRLIIKPPENLNEGTPSANNTTDREFEPESTQF